LFFVPTVFMLVNRRRRFEERVSPDILRRKPMTDHFPLMVPGSKATSPPREVSAPYDGTLLATVDRADSGVAECVSVQRVFAHRSIAKDLADRLGQLGSKLRVDDPTLPETEVGPLIRHKEVFSATPSIHACNQTFTNGR
jgi:hypothetical protein